MSFYTPAILALRNLRRHDLFPGVSVLVIDEVHERSLDVDVLITLACRALKARKDFVVVLMSSTLDKGLNSFLSIQPEAQLVLPCMLELHRRDVKFLPVTPRLRFDKSLELALELIEEGESFLIFYAEVP